MGSESDIYVTKRTGELENFDIDKIHKVLFWATERITNVSVSELEIRATLQRFNEMTTKEIHDSLIKAAIDLISEEYPNYQYVAARLINFQLRKMIYGSYEPPHIKDIVTKNIQLGVYDSEILSYYTDEEWDKLNKIVNHDRDNGLTYAAIEQFRGKYLVQNRTTKQHYETPQVAYILVAAILFNRYPKETRLTYVKDYYDAISKMTKATNTLPTPVLAGVRTPVRQYSSCVKIESGDSLDSINESASAIVDYASRRAGIGINAGRIRAKGSAVRSGEVYHTGVIPFYKYFHAALKSCSQGGVRGASATLYAPLWHLEAEDIIVLKNNKGTEETRVRHLDYGIQLNGLIYKKIISNDTMFLFSPHQTEDLYEAFFNDQVRFEELYSQYAQDPNVSKIEINALEHFTNVMFERNNTGRIYIQNVDHSNTHSSFIEATSPVRMSNLCVEVTLPTAELTKDSRERFIRDVTMEMFDGISAADFREKYGEIALCTLSAINLGAINSPEELQYPCELAVRALDELLDYQDYPIVAAGVPALKRRSLGVGVCNLAYFLAKRDLKYSDGSANDVVNQYAEAMSYYLIEASCKIAEEKGACDWFSETKYSRGIFPIDTYKKDVDSLVTIPSYMNWDELKERVAKFGMRHSTLGALMPVETSSQVINATNGIEPPRNLISVKSSKDGVLKQVVPEPQRLKNKYEYLWDMPQTRGYLAIAAIFQKWVDQSISTNTSYNPENYPDNKVPTSELLRDVIFAYKHGLKTLYYQNTMDGSGESEVEAPLPASDDPSSEDGSCESCVL